ncbi:MAG TPA: hypothetical protein VMU96_09000 [Casimicrobiaceae bacterium]|nr:hypothetical protein [Casimicrobiaceae bacterium]
MPSPRSPLNRGTRLASVAALAFAASGIAGGASTYDATPDNYRRMLRELRPGDTLALAPGRYAHGLPLHGLGGDPDHPITIAGPAQGPPALFVAERGHNTVSIVDSHDIVVKNLELDGRDLPVDGVKCEGQARYAHHVTLENLSIRRYGNNQQTVGISTKCPAWNWIIRGNTIVGAGTGMYLGNSDGTAPFVAGLIERNLVVDTIGYNLQIKHQIRRPDVPGLPQTSVTTIRHNVFSKAAGGSTDLPRPNVLVGHFPPFGDGVDDRYAIYGNFFYANRDEALFQGEGNIALYSNLFVNPYGDAIHIQPHNDIPKQVDIAFNTVLAERTGIRVVTGMRGSAYRQSVVGNLVFAATPLVGGDQAGNFAGPFADADRYLVQPFGYPGEIDLVPRAPLTSYDAEARNPGRLPDWDRDFNGGPRMPGAIGAYSTAGMNPGWHPALSLMPD